jgi:molybdate transport system substrate-binding protein
MNKSRGERPNCKGGLAQPQMPINFRAPHVFVTSEYFLLGLLAKTLLLTAAAMSVVGVARAQRSEVRVAAAADLKFAMSDLAQQYEKQTGSKVNATYGSSGNFFSQIQNGAPFDIFFSADIDYPRKLEVAGLAAPGTLYEYAVGRIVIWMPADSTVDLAKQGWAALLTPGIEKIAIANPAHAPYGRAAVAALRKAGIYQRVAAKLVYGENISQAAQFVQSGSAQAGIVALSLATSPPMKDGKLWKIPAEMHSPIQQAAIMLKGAKNKEAVGAFVEFVKSEVGRATLEKYGFLFPSPDSQARP